MSGKKVQCTHCSNVMRSDNLKRYLHSCIVDPVVAGKKRARLEYTEEIKLGADHQPNNLKLQTLADKIINDGNDGTRTHARVQRTAADRIYQSTTESKDTGADG